jgi:uncharacterized protein
MAKLRKDFDYFAYFSQSADYICQAAQYLHESLQSFDRSRFSDRMQVMHEIENQADATKHDMMKHLMREFIPPIDREDILDLAHELDNVVDALDDIMRRIYMFDVQSIRPESLQFTELILRCCAELKNVVEEFRSFKSSKTIQEKIVMVNTLESDGDLLHARCFHAMFSEGTSDRDLLIWSALFDEFEECLDACEHAGDVIESVIMKNA